MPVDLESTIVVTKTPTVFFTGTNFPGVYAGKCKLNLLATSDLLTISLETKYSSGDTFHEDDKRTFIDTDKVARLTPVREDVALRYLISLEASSPSTTVNVDVVVTRDVVV